MEEERTQSKTQEKIEAAFLAMLAHKDLEDITVTGICSRAGTGRSSFYCYYRDSRDVLRAVEDRLLTELSSIIACSDLQDLGFYYAPRRYVASHRGKFRLLLKKDCRFALRWKDAVKASLIPAVGENQLLAETAASAVVSAYSLWLEGGGIKDFASYGDFIASLLKDVL